MFVINGAIVFLPPTYHCRSPTGDKPYPLHRGNLLLSYISTSTWGNERRARNHYHHLAHQENFWHRCQGLRVIRYGSFPLPFTFTFLVLLVYLSFFVFVS